MLSLICPNIEISKFKAEKNMNSHLEKFPIGNEERTVKRLLSLKINLTKM
jgi:hypothetical protein